MAERRGASLGKFPTEKGQEYTKLNGKTYIRGGVKLPHKLMAWWEDPLESAQDDLSAAWRAYTLKKGLSKKVPYFLKHATGECPELVRDMLQEIVKENE